MAQTTSSNLDQMTERTASAVKDLAGQAQGAGTSMTAQGREASEGIQEVVGNIKGAIDKSVIDQPMATLAIAAGVGFVLGALWKS